MSSGPESKLLLFRYSTHQIFPKMPCDYSQNQPRKDSDFSLGLKGGYSTPLKQ
jgi:hypothetical protein